MGRETNINATDIFSERLKELRQNKGLSLKKLACDLDVTAQSLSLYETGQRTINIDLLKKIAEYFNVSADYLIGISDVLSADITTKAICDYTKLSEEALKEMLEWQKYPHDVKITNSKNYSITEIDFLNGLLTMNYGSAKTGVFSWLVMEVCRAVYNLEENSRNAGNLDAITRETQKRFIIFELTEEVKRTVLKIIKYIMQQKEASDNGEHQTSKE